MAEFNHSFFFFLRNSEKSVKFGSIIWILRPEVILLMILGRLDLRQRQTYMKKYSDGREFKDLTIQSFQFSCSVVSDSLRPHELQHARPPCPSPTPRVDSNSCPSSQWCHPAISSSVVPFSSCPQSLPESRSCPMSSPSPFCKQTSEFYLKIPQIYPLSSFSIANTPVKANNTILLGHQQYLRYELEERGFEDLSKGKKSVTALKSETV